MSRAIHLKIKLKTLAAESRVIRGEERKKLRAGRRARALRRDDAEPMAAFEVLRDYRTGGVRSVSRLNHLAYGFLRGRAYAQMEASTRSGPDLNEVLRLARRFGTTEDLERWPAWLQAAVDHCATQPGVVLTVPCKVLEVA